MVTPEPVTFVADTGDELERLDRVVVNRLARAGIDASRSAVQRWIAHGRVTIDGRPAEPSDKVRRGVEVRVVPMGPERTALVPDPTVPFDVLYEDPHLIVVDKPPHVVVHPARGHADKTLVHGLLARGSFVPREVAARAEAARAGAPSDEERGDEDILESERPGIVHRLDKGTSGILVVAKDEKTREGLKALFAEHDIERAYRAIVVGRATDRTFDTLHGRHPTDRLKFTSRVSKGKRAVTHVKAIEPLFEGRATLVECRLETGRTHQIRVHLSESGQTPILGDPLYGRAPRDPELRAIGEQLGRQALHAALLGFVHPITGAALRFEREPPEDFRRALQALRAR